MKKSLLLHEVAKAAGLKRCGTRNVMVESIRGKEVMSSCAYWVTLEDWKGKFVCIKARGVDYIARVPGIESPLGWQKLKTRRKYLVRLTC
jgi:hypothetical protein